MSTFPYSQLVTDTMETNLSIFQDQVFTENYLLNKIIRPAKPEGGRYLSFQVNLGKNTTAQPIDPYADFPITNSEKRTKADFDWKLYEVSIEMYDWDIWINSSSAPAQIINSVKAEFENAMQSLNEQMSIDLFQLATTRPNGLVGLQTAVSTSPTTGTYGGISRVTNADWGNQADTMAALDLDVMYAFYLSCSDGNDEPDEIVTTKTILPFYNNKLTPIQRINSADTGNAGFKTLQFLGTPIRYDNNCPGGYMYYLNTKYIKANYLKGVRFYMRDPVVPVNKAAQVKSIFWAGCFYITKPNRQGVHSGVVG